MLQFFEDLCTVNELLSLSQRFEVATMLREHKTYLEIAEQTGASTATISRVNRSLNYGSDGYELIFERLADNSKMKNPTNKAAHQALPFLILSIYLHQTQRINISIILYDLISQLFMTGINCKQFCRSRHFIAFLHFRLGSIAVY